MQSYDDDDVASRRVVLTPASGITPRPVVWRWEDRIAAGTLVMGAGREGTGKSQHACWIAAETTKGTLPGDREGRPAPVIYAAAEDSWAQTIVPRLMAAGADLDLVYRVSVLRDDAFETVLTLPVDLLDLEARIREQAVALVVLDPLISAMSSALDSHRNREVRQVLDPLAAMADRTDAVLYGIAHFNKSAGTDASSLISGSGAFKDVPRAVLGFARDEETNARVMTQTKNSLGRDDLASLAYEIVAADIDTPTGPAHVSRFVWKGESDRSVADLLRDGAGSPEDRSERDEAVEWLGAFLSDRDGAAPAAEVYKAAKAARIAERTLRRARAKAKVTTDRQGFGEGAVWSLPGSGHHSGHSGQPFDLGRNGRNEAGMGDGAQIIQGAFPGAEEIE